MSNNIPILSVLKSKLGIMLLFGVLFAILGFSGLMLVSKPVSVSMDFLVVQTGPQAQDFYSQFKSSEYLGKVLSEAVYSERFITAVVETGNVTNQFLPIDKRDRLKEWQKMISVHNNLELGIIGVTVSGSNERTLTNITRAVSGVLTERNILFRGGDEKSVEVRVLSGPIVEHNPTVARIVGVVGCGFITGFLLTALYFLSLSIQPAREHEIYRGLALENIKV